MIIDPKSHNHISSELRDDDSNSKNKYVQITMETNMHSILNVELSIVAHITSMKM